MSYWDDDDDDLSFDEINKVTQKYKIDDQGSDYVKSPSGGSAPSFIYGVSANSFQGNSSKSQIQNQGLGSNFSLTRSESLNVEPRTTIHYSPSSKSNGVQSPSHRQIMSSLIQNVAAARSTVESPVIVASPPPSTALSCIANRAGVSKCHFSGGKIVGSEGVVGNRISNSSSNGSSSNSVGASDDDTMGRRGQWYSSIEEERNSGKRLSSGSLCTTSNSVIEKALCCADGTTSRPSQYSNSNNNNDNDSSMGRCDKYQFPTHPSAYLPSPQFPSTTSSPPSCPPPFKSFSFSNPVASPPLVPPPFFSSLPPSTSSNSTQVRDPSSNRIMPAPSSSNIKSFELKAGGGVAGDEGDQRRNIRREQGGREFQSLLFTAIVAVEKERMLSIKIGFHPDLNEAFKSIPRGIVDQTTHQWLFPLECFAAVQSKLNSLPGFHINWEGLPPFVMKLLEAMSSCSDDSALYDNVLRHRIHPLEPSLDELMIPFQKVGVQFGLKRGGRVLIGDEMGLGKTVQACCLLQCYRSDWPALIITPSSLREQWADAVHHWLKVTEENVLIVYKESDLRLILESDGDGDDNEAYGIDEAKLDGNEGGKGQDAEDRDKEGEDKE
eukprot:CAMPEP_0175041244 /NCGR_PEP_ID=MMETSP0052_2-20121109/1798_1 /TAXON_ID=51329 ORGANISM="Polytomella parva, Strain SAG 63-3" /NCGR_SAMPLE_ID=MMETSP0052_2 /ASSEMBLY_ACC=CAM_ASM_000194 /LENGTH=606 /DNA_ID=CAMNT_0016303719 /DNA_START=58 /DNA_END=1875 /DNA_ORIENTATION=-